LAGVNLNLNFPSVVGTVDVNGRQVVIREIYGATEGIFGQQLDEKRAWVPNYDLFFFENETGALND